jgi:hypothetical protein
MLWGRKQLPTMVEYVWPNIITLLYMGEADSAMLPSLSRTSQYQFRPTLIPFI